MEVAHSSETSSLYKSTRHISQYPNIQWILWFIFRILEWTQ
jgi:hypothetical protein